MSKVFLIAKYSDITQDILNNIKEARYECSYCDADCNVILKQIEKNNPDIILIDVDFDNCEILTKQIKTGTQANNTQVILLLDKGSDVGFLNFADGFISKPVCKNILVHTIDSHIKIKKSLEQLSENNRELARSLYQLNVLYNTSSQFAGTLDKNKLYDIMLEALEKTLSFDISCALVFNTQGEAQLFINSLYEPTDSLKDALAIRLMLEYKNLFSNEALPHKTNLEDIKITKQIKPSHKQNIYDLKALNFDSLFAPIKVGENFFGVIELFRSTPFTKEDVTCFQTIIHQAALPLRSATLYEEIKNTNVKLEKLERLKSEFVSIVSHELRTPLTPINNSLEIVLSEQTGPISDAAKNFINMAKRNVARLSGIIEDLLDLSRVQTGKLDFKFKKTSLLPSLELIQKTFEQSAYEKNIKVSLEINGNLPEVYADTHRVEQILSNLVTNALKFTPEGGSIKVITKIVDSSEVEKQYIINPACQISGKYIQISTIDTGIGIKKENITKIFEKFSQIENSLTRNIGGVGLGLPITKQLVDAHLGAILVKSEENKGSNFSVLVPLIDEKKIFIMDMNQLSTSSNEAALVHIEQNTPCNFYQHLLENNILKLTKKSKELKFEKDGVEHYFLTLCPISQNALDFIEKTVVDESKMPRWQNCGIVLQKAFLAQDNKDAAKILSKLN